MLFLICRKDTTFPRNFQGFREKILEKGEEKKKIGGSRNWEPPIECYYIIFLIAQSLIAQL